MRGKITLVGAGPGEVELLTVKAVRKLQEADAVFFDRLINQDLLNYCSDECEFIDVGKKPKHHKIPQAEIEEMIIEKAKEGKQVVRLKSGDPYVFGRGGEEGKHISGHELDFEVIPGITSAIGGLAYAGIPITHRDYASSFHVITGHLKSEENQLNWQSLSEVEGTLVFLMGMSELKTIVTELTNEGKSKETPVAIIRWATRREQKTVTGTLETITKIAEEEQMSSPSLIVIGDVVTQREYLNFYENRPLFGKRIALPYTEKKKMYQRLVDMGASVFELPKLRKEESPTDFSIDNMKRIVFLDSESIEIFLEELVKNKQDIRQLQQIAFVTVGHHTELALKKIGICPDERFDTVIDVNFSKKADTHTLFIGEQHSIDDLNVKYSDLNTWSTHRLSSKEISTEELQKSDYVFLPSSKAAYYFLKRLSKEQLTMIKNKKIIVMGEITAKVFESYGIGVIKSEKPSYSSVLATLIEEDEQ